MDWQSVVSAVIVSIAAVLLSFHALRKLRRGNGCGGDCGCDKKIRKRIE